MQQFALDQLGIPKSYVALNTPPHELKDALTHLSNLGYQGANCTLPLKEVALQCTHPDDDGRRIGAVNTVQFPSLKSINTDALGMMSCLKEIGVRPEDRVLVLGAGGSARAVHYALLVEEYRSVFATNRTTEKLKSLRAELLFSFEIVNLTDPLDFDFIIDATSANALGEKLSLNWSGFENPPNVFSLMYGNTGPSMASTPFLIEAAAHGCKVFDGRLLLASQGILSLAFWLGNLTPGQIDLGYRAMKSALGISEF